MSSWARCLLTQRVEKKKISSSTLVPFTFPSFLTFLFHDEKISILFYLFYFSSCSFKHVFNTSDAYNLGIEAEKIITKGNHWCSNWIVCFSFCVDYIPYVCKKEVKLETFLELFEKFYTIQWLRKKKEQEWEKWKMEFSFQWVAISFDLFRCYVYATN